MRGRPTTPPTISKEELEVYVTHLKNPTKTVEEKGFALSIIEDALKNPMIKSVLGTEKMKEIADAKKLYEIEKANASSNKTINVLKELQESYTMRSVKNKLTNPDSAAAFYESVVNDIDEINMLEYYESLKKANSEAFQELESVESTFTEELKTNVERARVIETYFDRIKKLNGQINEKQLALIQFSDHVKHTASVTSTQINKNPKNRALLINNAKSDIAKEKEALNAEPNLQLLATQIQNRNLLIEEVKNAIKQEKQIVDIEKKYNTLKQKQIALASEIAGMTKELALEDNKLAESITSANSAYSKIDDEFQQLLKNPNAGIEDLQNNFNDLEKRYSELFKIKVRIVSAKYDGEHKKTIEEADLALLSAKVDLDIALSGNANDISVYEGSIIFASNMAANNETQQNTENPTPQEAIPDPAIEDQEVEYVNNPNPLTQLPTLDFSDINMRDLDANPPSIIDILKFRKIDHNLDRSSNYQAILEAGKKIDNLTRITDEDEANYNKIISKMENNLEIKTQRYKELKEYQKDVEKFISDKLPKITENYKLDCTNRLIQNTCDKLEADLKNQLKYWHEHKHEIKNGVTVLYETKNGKIPVVVPTGLGDMLRILDPNTKPSSNISRLSIFKNKQASNKESSAFKNKQASNKESSAFDKLKQCNKIAKRRVLFAGLKRRGKRASDGQKHNTEILSALSALDVNSMKNSLTDVDNVVIKLATLNGQITKIGNKTIQRNLQGTYTPPSLTSTLSPRK